MTRLFGIAVLWAALGMALTVVLPETPSGHDPIAGAALSPSAPDAVPQTTALATVAPWSGDDD